MARQGQPLPLRRRNPRMGAARIPPRDQGTPAESVEIVNGQEVRKLKPGSITSAACFAWNNCWFFGTYGTVVHWNGETTPVDASPERSQSSLQGEYTGAVARQGPAGEPFGAAVAATSEEPTGAGPLSSETAGAACAAVRLQRGSLLAARLHPIHDRRQPAERSLQDRPHRRRSSTRPARAGWRATPRGCA